MTFSMVNAYVAWGITWFILVIQLKIIRLFMVKKMIGPSLLFRLYDEMNPSRQKKTLEISNYLGELT